MIAPAMAQKSKAEAEARAAAASVAAQGRAGAAALTSLAQAYKQGGHYARESLLLQKLLPVFEQLTGTMKALRIDRLTVMPGGSSGSNGDKTTSLGSQVITTNEQVRAVTGVDMLGTLQRRMLADSPPPPPAPAPRSK